MVLQVLILAMIVNGLLLGCHSQVKKPLVESVQTPGYLIDKLPPDEDLKRWFADTNLSSDGAFLYKGFSHSPFGNKFNDGEALNVPVTPSDTIEIFIYSSSVKDDSLDYLGRISLETATVSRVVRIPIEDINRVLGTGFRRLLILKNGSPILKYLILG